MTFIIVEMKIVLRVTFENALDGMFKCPSCQNVLNLKKNDKSKKAYSKKSICKNILIKYGK